MRDRLPSGSTTNNNGTPCRVSPLITARRHPSKGCRLRVMTTEVGKSWEWVVCGVFHAELLKSVARRIVDRRVLHLIRMWLDCPVEETDDRGRKTRTTEARDTRRGIPQGSPITPRTQKVIFALIE